MEKTELLRGELIGLYVEAHNTGCKGLVIDETKNTLTIDASGRKKTLMKPAEKFTFTINAQKITVDGKEIALRPADRIKGKKKWQKKQ